MSDDTKHPPKFGEIEIVPQEKLPVYDGVIFPGFPELMTDPGKKLTAVKNLESHSDDILISAYPKSGTHWVSEIVEEIVSGKAEYSKKSKGGLFLEAQPLEELAKMPSPRNLNSHLPFRMLPRKHFELKARTIHVIRNPKDVAVSYYHHAQKDPCCGAITLTWAEYYETYIDNVIYGTWFSYEKEWEKAKKDNPNISVLTLYYEDLKRDTAKGVKQISEYLGYKHSDQLIKDIAENVDFQNQSKKKYDMTQHFSIDKKPFVYRKGQIGDWKNFFTVAQNEKFDALYEKEMKDSKLKITFT